MKLSDLKIKALSKPGKYSDGAGLYLEFTPSGAKYWRWKYRYAGKEKRLAFGVYPEIGLKSAREKLYEARKQLQAGHDPSELRKAAKVRQVFEADNSFEVVAKDWLEHQSAKWEPVTLNRIRASLEADIFPAFGTRPIANIQAMDVMKAVREIETRGAGEMAGRVLQRVKSVFRYAMVHQRLEVNPLVDLVPSEILKPRRVQHRPALAEKDLPDFLTRLDSYEGDVTTIRALRLLMLTATRPGEVRGAEWSEFELKNAKWRIPAERMKMKIEHIVPLSKQALAIVEDMKAISGEGTLVFPSPFYPSKPLSENTFNSALARMGYKSSATAHGFRALFSTAANEAEWNADVIERQLAHAERNEVRAAYNRTSYLPERAKMMQWWADRLDESKLPVE